MKINILEKKFYISKSLRCKIMKKRNYSYKKQQYFWYVNFTDHLTFDLCIV